MLNNVFIKYNNINNNKFYCNKKDIQSIWVIYTEMKGCQGIKDKCCNCWHVSTVCISNEYENR
jgi:hypothetical protein